jgi:hypothetical protein
MSCPVKQVIACASLDNEIATCSVSSIHELCDCGGDGCGEEEEDDKHEPEPVSSCAKAHTAFQTVK